MKTALTASAAALMLFAAACADSHSAHGINRVDGGAAQIDAAQIAASRRIYEQRCARCHQANGAGGDIQIDAFSLKVPNLTDARAIAETDDEYRRKIENGGGGMPKFKGKLTPNETADLVRYIRVEIQGK